ncbi:DUF1643 domain-containing protein [Bacillus cereus]|uniref:DUF1643 domain-containing protein n=1 Tax=Bacillus cereus TaxID=1396 RepID=UPI00159BE36B|nr:DUF1643 domain-containing protein [Bacillus cereus]
MKQVAVIEGNYRYSLIRDWTKEVKQEQQRRVLFIMLNPSTANAFENDQTTQRCIGFAKSFHYTSLEIVNLFAWISTNWNVVKGMKEEEAIGPKNDEYIKKALNNCDMVIAAWGDEATSHKSDRLNELMSLVMNEYKKPIYCLGKTGIKKQPRHPSRLAKETKLEVFR